jgi:hypothetical protein
VATSSTSLRPATSAKKIGGCFTASSRCSTSPRRRDPRGGGLGSVTLEKMLGCPQQHLEFPLWYLKQARGWIQILDTGQIAITVEGIDKLSNRELELPKDRLIAERAESSPPKEQENGAAVASSWRG